MLVVLNNRVLLLPYTPPVGNLLLTNVKPTQFKVISVGENVSNVKIDDIVYVMTSYGQHIEHDKEKYLIIEDNYILAKIPS